MDDCLVWTENELQLLETLTDLKDKKVYEWVNLKCVKDKHAPILSTSIFVSNLSQEDSREYFQHVEGIFQKRSNCCQNEIVSVQI